MTNKLRDSSRDLLACFFSECESRFRFLEQRHGYSYLSGLVEYRQGRQIITPYQGEDILGSFRAVTRYEKDDLSLEILYGDAEYSVEGYAYFQHIYRLNLSEILSAVKKSDHDIRGNWLVTRKDMLEKTLNGMAESLRKHKRFFIDPNPKIIDRAMTMRSKRIEQAVREQYRKDIQHASTQAARAFMEKNFRRVVEIYSPYEKDLNAADLKKLMLARKNLQKQA